MPEPMSAGPSSQALIVFLHANGFPGSTYGALFDAWRQAGWSVVAPEKLGHDPARPPRSGWSALRDELIEFIERECAGRTPVALVGHSMGGYMALLVAARRPDLVGAVVLLDSPIVSGWRASAFKLLKASGMIRRGGPGRVSARRRQHWASRDAARQHFESKPAFARWDPRVLHDYLSHGLAAAPDGVRLAFDRDVETAIYNTLPHHVGALLERQPLHCPVAFVAGRWSRENRQLGLRLVRRLAGPRWRGIEGSHLFPMERPDETAALVLSLLDEAAGLAARTVPLVQGQPGSGAAGAADRR